MRTQKINLINEFLKTPYFLNDILDCLLKDGVITENIGVEIFTSYNKADKLYNILSKALKDNKVQHINYSWQILPHEKQELNIIFNSFIKTWRK